MSEAEEIEQLIDRFADQYESTKFNTDYPSTLHEAKAALIDRIQSIITERDALRKAAQSNEGKQ